MPRFFIGNILFPGCFLPVSTMVPGRIRSGSKEVFHLYNFHVDFAQSIPYNEGGSRGTGKNEGGLIKMAKTLAELKRGEYFTLKPIAEPTADQVFIKGWFDRKADKYDCEWYNRNPRKGGTNRLLKSTTVVYVGFDF